jgi:DNA polymerase elongation subunit (family B)
MVNEQPRILVLDIETLPNLGYCWGRWQQDIIRFVKQTCIATFSAKWLHEKKIISRALCNYPKYKGGSYDDKKLVQELWELLNEADIVIAHNGNSFDIKVCNARFIFHGMKPPAPFKAIDTKKIFSEIARFNTNKLDDLCQLFQIGQKVKTDFDLWEGCINGDKKSWDKMVEYNERDVIMLEELYLRALPWVKDHPNLTLWTNGLCPKCGSPDVQYRGYQVTTTRVYRRFQCQDCGGWGRSVKSEKMPKALTTNCG